MALRTAGTAATTTLSALRYDGGNAYTNVSGAFSAADLATFNNAIKDDSLTATASGQFTINETTLSNTGLLIVPNRGFLQLKAGDYVAYDTATGWPILISARAIAGAAWVNT
jgi:hypothetical protein